MIFDTHTRSHVGQCWIARDEEAATLNRERLESWAIRYPHDLVDIPPCINSDGWPPTCRTEKGYVLKSYPGAKITRLKIGKNA